MNKRQKLVQQQFLNNEEAVIKRLKSVYNQSLKDITEQSRRFQIEINELQALIDIEEDAATKATLKSMQQSKIYQKQYQEALKKQINSILDKMQVEEFKTVDEYLKQCYEDGFIGTMYDLQGQGIPLSMPLDQESMVRAVQTDSKISQGLYTRLGEDVDLLKKKITAQVSRGIATGMTFQQVAKQLSNYTNIGYNNAVRIARTEGHRVQVQSTMDACYGASEMGCDIVKQWDSTLDKRTRKSHAMVDGEIRELDEPFSNGLMYPGDSNGGASEVVNCRCALLQRARWALDDDELETLKKRAEYFGLDKTDNFNDFKKKYLKAVTVNKNSSLKDIIDDLKKEIASNGGKITEEHLHKAGKAVQEDLINNERFAKRTKELKELEAKNKKHEKECKDIGKQRDENQRVFQEKLAKYRKLGKNTDELFDEVNRIENELYEKENKIREKWIQAYNELKGKRNDVFFENANDVKATLEKIREMGYNGIKIDSHLNNSRSAMKKVVKNAYDYYPKEWVEKSVQHGNLTPKKVQRGYYSEYEKVIAISGGSEAQMFETAIHELGHRMERAVDGIREAEKAFYDRRTKGEELQWLGYGYSRSEKSRFDDFISKYMGKDYGGSAYELVSMGFQYAYTDPEKLMTDSDMAEWIYGLLSLM